MTHATTTKRPTQLARDIAAINAALAECPPRCRAVFILARREGLGFEEIAARMHISVRSVHRYVERALEHCMHRLDSRGRA